MGSKLIYEVAVIGAGIAGAGVASFLGSDVKTLILEQEERPGYHSTGRSAAIFIQNYGSPEIRILNKASYSFLKAPPADFSENGFLSDRGMMLVADEEGEQALADELNAGDGLVFLSPSEAAKKVPLLREDKMRGAAFEKEAQDIDVAALHQAFLRRSKTKGAELYTDAELLTAKREQDIWLLTTKRGEFRARTIVNAAGAWADKIATACGVQPVGITPMRRSMAVLPAPEGYDCESWPLVADILENWYMKPDAGRLLVSPSDEIPVAPHDAYVDDMVLAEGLYAYEQATHDVVGRVENQWAGLRCFAPDRNPVAGFDEKVPGFFWLAGQGGYGIQTAPALSKLAACLLFDGKKESWMSDSLISGLNPSRFQ